MESNLDAPQNSREIAAACGLTVWQLEGLLHRRLNDSPVHTCSYSVPGILARCFRSQFGTSPRGLQKFSDERLRRVRIPGHPERRFRSILNTDSGGS
jgi:transcriptional regulator GlxA family with amidase domain